MEVTGKEQYGLLGLFKKDIRKRLISGALVLFPVYITFIALKYIFLFAGGTMVPVVKRTILESEWIQLKVPDVILTPLMFLLGLMMFFLALYFAGAFATNYIGSQIIRFAEAIVEKMPLVKTIYGTSKQIVQTATLPGKTAFQRVVLVDFPKTGSKGIGFVTGSIENKEGHTLTNVFVPTSPNPWTGFVLFVTEKEIEDTNLTLEEGIRIVVSGGVLVPGKLRPKELEKSFPA
ncbi:MAG TPA: DUF502 domain-containing protein [Candidatus Hypogeohydataceae bacterium YC41]